VLDSVHASTDLSHAKAPAFPNSTCTSSCRKPHLSAGLGIALDRRDVKGPFRLPKEPEFLFIEEATVRRRSWSENLTYYTGSGYLAGAVLGGGTGAYRAFTSPVSLATATGLPSQRLRVNQLLNTSGKLGRTAGNALGVVGLFFASSESFLRHLNDDLVPDEFATVGAGALTGGLYRSVRGPRQAAAAAVVGTLAGSALLAGRKFFNAGL
jgi:mitochondrial import inner membrane translocase subunit TIM23